jgi:hypothetical protein
MKLLKSQIDFIYSEATHTGLVAGFGSGKTEAAVAKTIIMKAKYAGINVAYYLPTYNLIKDIAMPRLKAKLTELGFKFDANISDKTLEVYNFGKSIGKIIMRTMDNPDMIVGYEVGYSLIDECDALPQAKMSEAFSQIIARNRSKLPDGSINKTDVVGTPEGYKWFYDFFVRKAKDSKTLIRARTMDNHHLPESYIKTLEDSYSKEQLLAYLEGEFVNLTSGTVYHPFDRTLNHTDRSIKDGDVLHIGLDFNIGNMNAVIHVIDDGVKKAVAELTGIYDTFEMARVISERFGKHSGVIYPDASGQNRNTSGKTDIDILKSTGMKILTRSKNPFVRDRVNATNTALCNGKGERTYLVNTFNCPTLTEALERQTYKGGEPDKASGFDHITEAIGYFITGTARQPTISGAFTA